MLFQTVSAEPQIGSFRKLGVPSFGVLIIRILLFRVPYLRKLLILKPFGIECLGLQVVGCGHLASRRDRGGMVLGLGLGCEDGGGGGWGGGGGSSL